MKNRRTDIDFVADGAPESASRRRMISGLLAAGATLSALPVAARAATVARPAGSAFAAPLATGKKPTSIVEAGRALRNGTYSSEELTKAYLQSIARLQPSLNAFITVMSDSAITQARQLDIELRAGHDRGPLHGIPIVHKDLYDTKGVPTTVGSAFFKDRVPDADAAVVSRLAKAGAIALGKTNMNEFAAGITGTNEAYGDIHNPWNLQHSPGGSSSGTGAAVAAGLALAGTGSDTGGSIRVPSSWDGLTGIRPTFGRVSLTGAFPRCYSLDCGGPLAHNAEDAAIMLTAMAGYDPTYKHSLHAPNENFSHGIDRGVKGLKLAIVDNYTYRDVDPDVAKAVEESVRTLESEGAQIINVKIPLLAKPVDFSSLFTILLYEFNEIMGDRYRAAPDKSKFGAIVQSDIAKGEKISRAEYEKALTARAQLVAQFKAAFAHADALITPTMPTTSPVLAAGGPAYDRGRQFMLPISWTGLPALSMQSGFDSAGLPVGLQLVGNARQEALLLRIAHAHQQAMPFYAKRPSTFA